MLSSTRALLTELIDYAGLFPPAKLPLEQALRQYAIARQGPDAWMLGRFILPAAQLGEVTSAHLSPLRGWSFAALGRGGNSIREFLDGLQADLKAIQGFCLRLEGRVAVEVYEVKLPAELLDNPQTESVHNFYTTVAERVAAAEIGPVAIYYEAAFAGNWRPTLPAVLPVGRGGFKLRCGGLEASAFPTVEQVAFAIITCRTAAIHFKATAGLHHPLRHTDRRLGVKMHGFLNVFGAALLAYYHKFNEEQVRAVIEDEDADHFIFDERQFRWQDVAVNLEQIRAGRETFAISFGSCSFDEPREDLQALGLLP